MKTNNPFGEVIESSLEIFTGKTWIWDNYPSFGSLVTIKKNDQKIYAIIYQVQTGSDDVARKPFAYQKTEEELKRDQPQIFEFLETSFNCILVGYKENDKIFYQIPAEPVKIHSFILNANHDEYMDFFKDSQFLYSIFSHENKLQNIDELLLAIFKNLKKIKDFTQDDILNFSQNYSLLTGNDYKRLKLFITRFSYNV